MSPKVEKSPIDLFVTSKPTIRVPRISARKNSRSNSDDSEHKIGNNIQRDIRNSSLMVPYKYMNEEYMTEKRRNVKPVEKPRYIRNTMEIADIQEG